jgi:indole-3-glycerol phosphate synthase
MLKKILSKKREEIAARKLRMPLEKLEETIAEMPPPRDFYQALQQKIAIIAEVKRRSPSRGLIRKDFDPRKIAVIYEQNNAAALSVLTDESFFGGCDGDLAAAKGATTLPVLRKEFIVDSYQIFETRAIGADAILLIASILEERKLEEYHKIAASLGLAALVEVHNRKELDAALFSGARIIGVNNRDLKSFKTDIAVSLELAPHIPRGLTAVSESGIESKQDIDTLMGAGIHAFLVGSALMAAPDIGAKLRELLG